MLEDSSIKKRSLNFSKKKENRYWWHHLNSSKYIPPVYSFLTDDEWGHLKNWFEETDTLYGLGTGECNVPAMSLLQGLIMGSGIKRVVQCGHYIGYSSIIIGLMHKKMGLKNGILSFDLNQGVTDFTQKWLDIIGVNDQVRLVVSDSAQEELAEFATSHFNQLKPELVFIDSSHQYLHTFRELDLWYPILQDGGFIILHDASSFASSFDSTEQGGVFRAISEWGGLRGVNTFCMNGSVVNSCASTLSYKDGCGLGLIQKPISTF